MPIFARRRLSLMLAELAGHLDDDKRKDFARRLGLPDTNTVLATESEISLLWLISKVAHLEVEPKIGSHRPDCLSNDLFSSKPAVVEIRALSDDSFSGKEAMDRTANIIASYADHVRPRSGKHLYFEFIDESGQKAGKFHRKRCVDPTFALTHEVEQSLRAWLTAPDWPNPVRIRIVSGQTDVVISWHEKTQKLFRTFCRMPSVAYDLEDNPIYKALKKKKAQVKGAPQDHLKCIFLFDAGCYLLRNLKGLRGAYEVSGEDIVRHSLRKLKLDVICVFSIRRDRWRVLGDQPKPRWIVTCFDSRNIVPAGEHAKLQAMSDHLPTPRYETYQARDIDRQGLFGEARLYEHMPAHYKWTAGGGTVKISTRLLLALLAGKIDQEKFVSLAFHGGENPFLREVGRGHSIQSVKLESGGLDQDDDHAVFELGFDWRPYERRSE